VALDYRMVTARLRGMIPNALAAPSSTLSSRLPKLIRFCRESAIRARWMSASLRCRRNKYPRANQLATSDLRPGTSLMKVFDVQAPTPQGPASENQQAFLIGLDFHEAALRAGLEIYDPAGVPITALCPMIVSYAFAAELYLKSLAGSAIKNHRLNVLYGRLSDQIRDDIAAFYQARTGRGPRDLEGDLRAFAVAFTDWRYVFEGHGQQLRVNLLVAFTRAVFETIRLRRPAWEVSSYRDGRIRAAEETPTMTVVNLGGGTFLQIVDGTGGTLNEPNI
jgi:hypothetical protein